MKIDTNDVLTTTQDGFPAITGANQGLIIIEADDYAHLVPSGYEIVGAQFLTSTEGTSIKLYEFDGALDSAATDTTGTTYSGATVVNDNDVVKITDIGVIRVTENSEALTLNLNVTVTDGDGDSFNQTLFVNPVTPVVLDLNGDAANFTSLASSNVAYDYDGDGVKTHTAWIAAGAAILAYDANGDHAVTNASEFVFGHDGLTDLQALAAEYDSNGDGRLDANDSTYGKFGVWLDNGDGVFQTGEFVSLKDAGITSIELTSDGNSFGDADGDVTVFGTASFTMEDGSTGAVYDAAFATGGDVPDGTMEALMALAAEGSTDDTAAAQTTQDEADATVAIEDAMAGSTVDAVIDHYVGDTGDAPALADGGHLTDASLILNIDGGGLAFDNSAMIDLHDDAAAALAAAA